MKVVTYINRFFNEQLNFWRSKIIINAEINVQQQ